jgi:hypothetical protein
MISEVTDRDTVAAYVKAARERLQNGEHDEAAARAVDGLGIEAGSARDAALLLADKLPAEGRAPGSQDDPDEPFISRDPLVSVLQSSLAAAVHGNGLATETPRDHRHHGVFSHVWQSIETFVEGGLSHHQFMTVYDQRLLGVAQPPLLVTGLNPLVDRGRVRAWFWGHEHRCMAFTHPGLAFPRCIGTADRCRPPAPQTVSYPNARSGRRRRRLTSAASAGTGSGSPCSTSTGRRSGCTIASRVPTPTSKPRTSPSRGCHDR